MKRFIIGLEINKLSHKIVRALEAEIIASVDKNMSATTARIITFVVSHNAHHDIFQKDIEYFMGLNRSSVSLILNNMEKNGFILRESVKDDARCKKIVPTEKALEYSKKIVVAFDKVEDKMKVGIKDLSKFEKLINKIEQNLDA